MRRIVIALGVSLAMSLAGCSNGSSTSENSSSKIVPRGGAFVLAQDKSGAANPVVGEPELIASFNGAMPTGVTISRKSRIFVNFPRWGDDVQHTVAEVKNGKEVAYPPGQRDPFVGVQSVVIDPADRLWVLDTGTVNMGPVQDGAAKLVCFDLTTDTAIKTITFPSDVALPTSYLNDVRFDLSKGAGGFAYITDSSANGPNGIVVVDLQSGHAWRKLNDDPSTKATKGFAPTVEGRAFMERQQPGQAKPMTMGSDGIALSADGRRLYYTPLISHELYSVSTDALRNESMPDSEVAKTIEKLGPREFASDGLEMDAVNNLYLTDYEHDAIQRRSADGAYTIIVRDPRIIWPDTMAMGHDGYLYFTANQLDRQKRFNEGKDLRQKPYALFRVRIDAEPAALKKE
jgi:sugar lactone lactonase YvrE